MRVKLACAASAALIALNGAASAATLVSQNNNALQLANAIAGPGVTVVSATTTGYAGQFGTFSGGAASVGFDSGVVISTGRVTDIPGFNDGEADASFGFDTNAGGTRSGDARLDAIAGTTDESFDSASLNFVFTLQQAATIVFEFVFGSDEYLEFVDQGFNDVFAFFLDNGPNLAKLPNGDPITIDNINSTKNAGQYRDNPVGAPNFDLKLDGLTTSIIITLADVAAGQHSFTFLIGDIGDDILDSAIFIRGRSFATPNPPIDPTPVPDVPIPGAIPLLMTGAAALGLASRKKRANKA